MSGELECTFSGDRQTAFVTLNVAGQRLLEEEEVIEEDGFLKEKKTVKRTKRRLQTRIPFGSLIMITLTEI